MSDVNDLNLREPEKIDYEHYEPVGAKLPKYMLPQGIYTLMATEPPQKGATREEGYLQATFPVIKVVAPGKPEDGAEIRYYRVNTKRWPGKNASGMADFLAGFGVKGANTNDEYWSAIEAVQGRTFQAAVDWKARCKECGFELKTMVKFPKDGEGKPIPWVDCPNGCLDNTDPNNPRKKRVFANAEIKFCVAAS